MQNRFLSLSFLAVLGLALLAGCGPTQAPPKSAADQTPEPTPKAATTPKGDCGMDLSGTFAYEGPNVEDQDRLWTAGVAAQSRNDYTQAIKLFSEIIRKYPNTELARRARGSLSFVHQNRGMDRLNAGKTDEAMADFNLGLKLNPTEPSLLSGKAAVYRSRKRFNAAEALYKRVLECEPNDPHTMRQLAYLSYSRGYNYYLGGKRSDALEAYEQAVKYDPSYADAYKWMGILVTCENPSKAEAHFKKALSLKPDKDTAQQVYLHMAHLAEIRQDLDQAKSYFDKAVGAKELDADSSKIYRLFLKSFMYDQRKKHQSSANFNLYVDPVVSAAQVKTATEVLEQALKDFAPKYRYSSSDKMVCILDPSLEEFQAITRSPDWSIANTWSKIRTYSIKEPEELRRVLRSGVVSVIAYRLSCGKAPSWLVSGLKEIETDEKVTEKEWNEYFSSNKGAFILSQDDLERELGLAHLQKEPPLDLFAHANAYGEFMYTRFGIEKILEIFNLLAAGMDEQAAIKQVTGLTYKEIQVGTIELLESRLGKPSAKKGGTKA